ncbi:MAG: hypothetical protein ICV64_02790 [Thermoleophilia bacterium]|nr:hypothetical protein [Thermoleophilia bacterium]
MDALSVRRLAAARLALAASCALVLGSMLVPSRADGSQLIDRDTQSVRLQVSADNVAQITYRVGGRARRVLAWGAVNALRPTSGRRQVAFRLDYSGGWRRSRTNESQRFRDRCRPYDGPALSWLVAACKGPDGSYWALQRWQRMLPNYGVRASATRAAWELRLSRWTGPLPLLQVWRDWVFYGSGSYEHLFGRFTYRGQPVYGFRATPTGSPLDGWGRNLYLDTFDSAYGRGWRRENSFLTHRTGGNFCYGFFPRGSRPPGTGKRYRITVIGPGVTPDVTWEQPALGAYDPGNSAHVAHERRMREVEDELSGAGRLCRRR